MFPHAAGQRDTGGWRNEQYEGKCFPGSLHQTTIPDGGHMKYQFISLIKLYMYAHNIYCYISKYLCKTFHEAHSKYLTLFKNIHFETIIGSES